jgi:glutamine amidotransferase
MIGIIDYGAGNTKSIINALERLNTTYFLSENSEKLMNADKLILPGVGHAKVAMRQLEKQHLVDFIKNWKKPFLGVCLGMQLLTKWTEEGNTTCLGIIDEKIIKFPKSKLKVPKMGWNVTDPLSDELFNEITPFDYFYFVHSYYLPSSKYSIAEASYHANYTAAVRKENFWGVQFHPEKSAKSGAQILQNFINI